MLKRAFVAFVVLNAGIIGLAMLTLWFSTFIIASPVMNAIALVVIIIFVLISEVISFASTLMDPLNDWTKAGKK
jgi:hypothetical protein